MACSEVVRGSLRQHEKQVEPVKLANLMGMLRAGSSTETNPSTVKVCIACDELEFPKYWVTLMKSFTTNIS